MVVGGHHTVLFVVLLGIIIYTCPRFPDTVSNRWTKFAFGLFYKFATFASEATDFLGLNGITVRRAVFDIMPLLYVPNQELERYTETMDGIKVLVVKPRELTDETLHRGIIHIHGGGWTLFYPEYYLPEIQRVVMETQSILVSVNYRRAPEHIFPAALEDCITVAKYFLKNAEQYGVDKNRIGIYGDSAGGNLAMATALTLKKDTSLPKLGVVTLIYPALQVLDFDLPSYNKYAKAPGFLTKKIMIDHWLDYMFGHRKYFKYFYENSHVSKEFRSLHSNKVKVSDLPIKIQARLDYPVHEYETFYPNGNKEFFVYERVLNMKRTVSEEIAKLVGNSSLAPLMAEQKDFVKFPPTFILTADIDVLRDEASIAAERLRRVGVDVEHVHLRTEEHGCLPFIEVVTSEDLEKAYTSLGRFIKKHV